MDKKQICIKFAREVCNILDISVPAIKFVPSDRMRTSTQIAALTPDAVLVRNDVTGASSQCIQSHFSFLTDWHRFSHSFSVIFICVFVPSRPSFVLEKAGNYPANSFLIFSATLSMSSSS